MAHPRNDVNVRGVVWGAVAIAIGILLVSVAAWLLWQRWGAPSGAQAYGGPDAGALPHVTPPILQSAPRQERAEYEAEKRKQLESWEWIDRQHGIARIPIEEAMRMMAAQSAGQSQGPSQNASQSQAATLSDAHKESP
jgi:hypothetical protein